MDNAVLMSWTEAAAAGPFCRISFSADTPQAEGGFGSVSIDSRNLLPGALFAALPGTRQDGHHYLEAAFRAGAAGALVARSRLEDPSLGLKKLAEKWGAVLLGAEDTLRALQELARAYLNKFPRLLKIGITGSSGKTTTKEIAAAIIGGEKRVVMNPGNLNSETGLPLSVFNVRAEHEVGIFEMGMNRRNEIGELTRTLNPHIALVTNVGTAHIGILGTKGAIAKEKKDIFSQFSGKELALIPADDEYRDFLAEGVRGTVRFYGSALFEEWGGVKDRGLGGTEILWDGRAAHFGLPGRHNLANALAAIAIARELPVSSSAVRQGLESVKPLFGRGEIIGGPVTVLHDAYNANPESAAAALAFCDGLDWPGRRVYVMGSMLELGALSEEAHRELGLRLASSAADMVCLFGEETRPAAAALKSSRGEQLPFFYTDNMEELSRVLSDYVRPGDLVLLKGSRGCALEELTGVLTEIPARSGIPAMAGGGA